MIVDTTGVLLLLGEDSHIYEQGQGGLNIYDKDKGVHIYEQGQGGSP